MSVELLSPAGDLERLRLAVAYGADAVYLAGTSFGMRAFAGNFDQESLAQAVAHAHSHSVSVYVTCNTMPRNDEVDALPPFLESLEAVGVDGIILADLGVFRLAQRHAPHIPLHISTQTGITNHAVAAAWHDLGASRVILARELSLDDIATVRAKTPKALSLEAFVHGAMCVSYSGRCLLSNYMTGRDASRGACSQPCRYAYALMEEKRPGEYFPIYEEDGQTYLLNSRDMCMIDHVPQLLAAGLDSLKIEGRAKSTYYAAIATAAYRHAIDAAQAGLPLEPHWRDEVEKVSHRHYSTGFYFGYPGQHTGDSRYIRDYQVTAQVLSCDASGHAKLSLRNKITAGEELELVGPNLPPTTFTVPEMADSFGTPLLQARNPQMEFSMTLPAQAPPLSFLRRQSKSQEDSP